MVRSSFFVLLILFLFLLLLLSLRNVANGALYLSWRKCLVLYYSLASLSGPCEISLHPSSDTICFFKSLMLAIVALIAFLMS